MKNVLGLDAGSITVSLTVVNSKQEIVFSDYEFHNGDISGVMKRMLEKIDFGQIGNIAVSASTHDIVTNGFRYDNRVCFIEVAKKLHPETGSLLMVGGETFGLIQFDEKGNYRNYKSNTSCAAGTGSFLDQQAKRLNIKSIEKFSEIANDNKGSIPKIASRCAVFAKTDLIHAQQEGYSAEEICDGLCYGLAKNITDTLFTSRKAAEPLVFAGGVSQNKAVVKHIRNITKMKLVIDEFSHLYGSYGACINLIKENKKDQDNISLADILTEKHKQKSYHFDPLILEKSNYPDFSSLEKYNYDSKVLPGRTPVETDIYEELSGNMEVFLGIDIGSTSTKAALIDKDRNIIAGFYTRTSGRPLDACRAIFETISNIENRKDIKFEIQRSATTGSGRKFIGNIIGADIVLDEITAHAAAAVDLSPEVDTIIEIGGQDAKFTNLKDGRVTFSVMNNVCAAGTGSFIEEQAEKLSVPLSEYSERAEKVKAPLSSDRCTVFMERDLNHYLNEGFSVDEVLASVLHSVRENYLSKVAVVKNIGEKIYFQGATAKNKALVAAFEQKLQKPIIVSKFCHLTGAIGCALQSMELTKKDSSFRGIDIYKNEIPVRTEICNLCNNHCKIRIAEVGGETCAYGFLCGRDYETKKFINQNQSGFDLLKERAKVFAFKPRSEYKEELKIGLPAALYMSEDMQLWKKFFDNLSIRVVTSENYKDAVKTGKLLSGAEFCAPMAALQGHVKYLYDRCDYVFLPVYLEQKSNTKNQRRHYCYYTQFATSIVKSIDEFKQKEKILSPVVRSLQNNIFMKKEIHKVLKPLCKNNISFLQISSAYDDAVNYVEKKQEGLRRKYKEEIKTSNDINVVLLGRPYTVLNKSMNSNLPDIFAKQGVKTFYQDMLDYSEKDVERIDSMLEMFHWHFATKILESAEYVAQQENIYPVFITSFKCSPDSFAMEYFKSIMDSYGKPYLILQLDEHDSSVGYETRVESAVRAFRNHAENKKTMSVTLNETSNIIMKDASKIRNKTILYPNWDQTTVPLICSVLKSKGYKVQAIEESEKSIFESLQFNTGQCIPLTAIAYNALEHVKKHKLDPQETVIWLFESTISCNIKMYPHYIEKLIRDYDDSLKDLTVYIGDMLFKEFGIGTSLDLYFAYLFGGFVKKIGCRIRPYEKNKGETDEVIKEAIHLFQIMFERGLARDKIVEEVVSMFENIETEKVQDKIKVALFGDLYARDNDVFNMNLIKTIENNGGEVITTPYTDYAKIIAESYVKKWIKEGLLFDSAAVKMLKQTAKFLENKYLKILKSVVDDADHNPEIDPNQALPLLDVKPENTGESMDNILKIFSLINHYDNIGLFVQTNPAYCCPSLVIQSMAERIEKVTGIPVLTLEYDGTGTSVNDNVIPYLKYPRSKK